MKLAALMTFPYNRRMLRAGDEFEASARDARVLTLARRARAVDLGAEAEGPSPAGSSPPPAPQPSPRRRYRRRDLRAEE